MERMEIALPEHIRQRLETSGDCNPSTWVSDGWEWERRRIELANMAQGSRTELNCDVCRNKGYVLSLDEEGHRLCAPCKCITRLKNRKRAEQSNLSGMLERCTFDTWNSAKPWQEYAKQAALDYAGRPEGWFYVGGSPGSGKTHLCTAVCKALMERGLDTRYVLWRTLSVQAKAAVNEGEKYAGLVDPLKGVRVLYIDDLFKTGRGGQPTTGDFNLAFEILNERYNDPEKITIVSSELAIQTLLDLDEAVGSRIYERSRGHYLDLSKRENYRLG